MDKHDSMIDHQRS